MMKKASAGLVLAGLLLLTACQSSSMDDMAMNPSDMKMIDVDLQVNPDLPKTDELVTLQATISQDGKRVKKVSEITFEIWKDDQTSDHIKVKAAKKEAGVYVVERKFPTAGTYNVTAHTTASGFHAMPNKQFQISAN
ncbi:FixH family protein [Paenibacillus alba]|uniref:FixH family protein n=1 Tax=Paenibacillus alba TaxID=1197127 RepID=UPI0015657B9D|nr:FixH family protein [Paenibacillus alba]NQX68114.1 FixH family protein [Paenibacillus alba]